METSKGAGIARNLACPRLILARPTNIIGPHRAGGIAILIETYGRLARRGSDLARRQFAVDSTSLRDVMVLVVDDDPGVRGLYVAVLRQAGALVMSSGIASEALELSDLQAPDVVITDLHMPVHDGIWLLREFKSRMPATPVILVSGYLDESGRGHLLRFGFADVLMKPMALSDLANAVARAVGG